MAHTIPANILGLRVSGDIGGLTIYSDRFHQKVVFPKSPPKDRPSPLREAQRARFKSAQEEWKTQSDQVKKNYEDLCRQANVVMTGQNMWIHVALTNDFSALQTLQLQTGITVPNPTFVP